MLIHVAFTISQEQNERRVSLGMTNAAFISYYPLYEEKLEDATSVSQA